MDFKQLGMKVAADTYVPQQRFMRLPGTEAPHPTDEIKRMAELRMQGYTYPEMVQQSAGDEQWIYPAAGGLAGAITGRGLASAISSAKLPKRLGTVAGLGLGGLLGRGYERDHIQKPKQERALDISRGLSTIEGGSPHYTGAKEPTPKVLATTQDG